MDVSGENTTQFGINKDIKSFLFGYMNEVLGIDPHGVEYDWSGIMGFTPEKNPIIRAESSQNMVWAVGLSGMGVALSTGLGKQAAELVS